jgi:hypothetical protein
MDNRAIELGNSSVQGMTIRELFAAMAMMGILSYIGGNQKYTAIEAVKYADLLLEELAK